MACLAAFLVHCCSCGAEDVFTSTRHVTGMASTIDGTLWVATTGGILRRSPLDGSWRKYTRLDGLPSSDARGIEIAADGSVVARFGRAAARWTGHRWATAERAPGDESVLAEAKWKGARLRSSPQGLRAWDGRVWRDVPLPDAPGSHVSAMVARPDGVWATFYGAGLFVWDGEAWRPGAPGLPEDLRECTALGVVGDRLFVGTRSRGVWSWEGGEWRSCGTFDEPPDADVQSLAAYRGAVFVGTLEDGLGVFADGRWSTLGPPLLSSDAPRQMAVFQDRLYVRHGGGAIDVFDGTRWRQHVERAVPRKQASTIAADAGRLYVGQLGGWSEFDGRRWRHFLHLPDLADITVTCILPQHRFLWIGTQGRGLCRVDRATMRMAWVNEASGLADDWVTALCPRSDGICVGTFVGGAALVDRDGRVSRLAVGPRVTSIVAAPQGLAVGTRSGLYWRSEGREALLPLADREVQALLSCPSELWIGTRTGLYRAGGRDIGHFNSVIGPLSGICQSSQNCLDGPSPTARPDNSETLE
jgi:ligand-binding sensor domain-containing protein